MLTRRLDFKLLAPTVLVSLFLLAACAFGVFFLRYLHINAANDLSENVQSTLAAASLEATTEKLIGLFRGEHNRDDVFIDQVQTQNQIARQGLEEAQGLANLEREKLLVQQIESGFAVYFGRWEEQRHSSRAGGGLREAEADLANLLEKTVRGPCRDLRSYNTGQIDKSDHDNRAIVKTVRWGLLAIGLGGPLGGLVLGYAVARSLRHSISQLSVRIRDAAGRLNRELGSVTLEEVGDLPDLHRQMQGVTEEIERVIEQLQQREREVLRAEQLAAVGQVAAGVAHELRNPLTSVKMLVQTGLEGESATGLPPEDLIIIEHEIRRMEQCIRLFLDFARPPDSERRSSDLNDVVRRALALTEGRIRRQKIHVTANLPAGKVVSNIDPEQIHQVLVNLLLNALDALPRGGNIQVEILPGQGPDTPANGHVAGSAWVEVRIRDSGPGIAPRIRERLFEPFVSSKETGLGLGLSICKRLIEAHGGGIQGRNVREGGAIFSFTLPVEEPLPIAGDQLTVAT